jgi:hypothetical protein
MRRYQFLQVTVGTLERVGEISRPRVPSQIERVWVLLPVFLLVYKSFIFPLPPLDFWWHLKMGQVISTTQSIPHIDDFSFTAAGRPFVLQNWFGELIYYWSYRIGGFPLLVFLGTVLTLTAFLFMYGLCLKATSSLRTASLMGFLAALGNYSFLRPQTYSFLLFAAFYFVISEYRERRQDRLWILPLLMVLWVNLHGAFILGLVLVGIYLFCETVRRFVNPAGRDVLSSREIRKLAMVLLLCGVATFLNPEGYKLYDYVRTVILDPGSQQLVAEWRPPRVNDFLGFFLFYCPFFLAVFSFIHSRVKPDFTEIVLFFAFATLGLTAIRNAAWFSTITYPLLARYLPLVDLSPIMSLRRFKVIDRLFRSGQETEDLQSHSRIHSLVLVAAGIVLLTQSPWIRPRLTGTSLLAEQTPVGAADFIQRQRLTGRIFHPQSFGDYLMWRLWPQQRTFVDGRVHLFSLDFLEDYETAIENPLAGDFLDRWHVQYLLLAKDSEPAGRKTLKSIDDSGSWQRMYEDDVSVLFERKEENGGQ